MKLTNEERQKIEELLRDSSYAKYHKRLQIIYFRSKEKSYKEIMDLLDCNKTTVWRNLKKYKEFGLEALLQETRGGRHREYMTYEEEQAFLKRHIEAAQAGESVTVNQLFEAYKREIGRTSTRDGFYYLLKRHCWRTVTPRPELPKKADAQTGDSFFLIAGGCNTEWTNEFLRQVSQAYPDDYMLLVMDNAIWHKSSTLYTRNEPYRKNLERNSKTKF